MSCNGLLSVVFLYCSLSLFVMCSSSLTDVVPKWLTLSPSEGEGTPVSVPDSPQEYLDAHNAARKAVGDVPLVWNNTLASYAESYANTRKDCSLVHSKGPYGENLAMGSPDLSASAAVQLWVDENKEYHHDSSPDISPDMKCLHFTQVVWSGTTSVGCAKVHCVNGEGVFIICNYYPPGNVIGEKPF